MVKKWTSGRSESYHIFCKNLAYGQTKKLRRSTKIYLNLYLVCVVISRFSTKTTATCSPSYLKVNINSIRPIGTTFPSQPRTSYSTLCVWTWKTVIHAKKHSTIHGNTIQQLNWSFKKKLFLLYGSLIVFFIDRIAENTALDTVLVSTQMNLRSKWKVTYVFFSHIGK